ncbi:MAG TPA: hypothetical protein PLB89_04700 [Flavobacteriales bacterium]|nr:hypothetical protein [Flavobacteriales bacterium]
MINPVPYLNKAWAQASKGVKGVIVAIILALAIPFGITIAVMFWQAGYIQSKVEGLVTNKDLDAQTVTLQTNNVEQIDSVVNAAIAANDILMRQYIADERQLAIDTAFVPLLRQFKALTTIVLQMRRDASLTDARVKEIPFQFNDKLNRMLEANDPEATNEKLEALTDIVLDLKEDNRILREQLQSGRRNSKMKIP